MAVDSHRHFWHYTDEEFGWIDDDRLRRDFLPSDCGPGAAQGPSDPCVAVEARQCVEETKWLLSLAEGHSFIRGVVGWLPIAAEDFPSVLDEVLALPNAGRLCGLRHVVQDEPDDAFILRADFVRGVRRLLSRGLAYDILVFERHLPNVIKFVDMLPADSRLVLDHLGKPRDFASWRRLLREVARRDNVMCKVSGLVTEVGDAGREALVPYIDAALESFGPDRLMFGSDWPVVTAHMPYGDWRKVVDDFAAQLSQYEHDAIMGDNAAGFYRLRG
ncbi:MAG: amidohydrolase [Lentisphaerae bacterium]|nr:amidohydrolase [Lentisphaerota bacterium]